jgi:hypothetical protein
MHRSGTSALAGLLSFLGVEFGRNLMKPGDDNPKGFYEHLEIVGCHISLLEAMDSYYDDILPMPAGWEKRRETIMHREHLRRLIFNEFAGKPLWGFKDPRVCRLLPMWFPLFDELGAAPKFVLMVRNPDEIANSMHARGGHSYNQILLVALEHMLSAERYTRGRQRIIVSYDALLANWRREMDRIADGLGIPLKKEILLNDPRVANFLDPAMRHHVGAASASDAVQMRGADPRFARWAFGAYETLLASATDPIAVNGSELDRLSATFREHLLHIAAWRPPRLNKDRITKMHLHASRLDGENQRLQRENQELKRRLGQ